MIENYSEDQIWKRVEWFSVLCAFYGAVTGYVLAKEWYVVFLVSLVLLICVMVFFGIRWVSFIGNHTQGIRGEIKVGAMLAQLPSTDFWYHNDIVLPNSWGNIDHVVVGKTGVWLIETKHWDGNSVRVRDGRLTIDGRPFDEKKLRDLQGRSAGLREYLSQNGVQIGWVQSALVFSTDKISVEVPERFHNIHVVGFRNITKLVMQGVGNKLSGEQIKKIQMVIENRKQN